MVGVVSWGEAWADLIQSYIDFFRNGNRAKSYTFAMATESLK